MLLLILNLGLHDVAAGHLAETLPLLAGVEKTLGLFSRELSGGVPPLGDDQRVVVPRHRDGEPALRDLEPGVRQRFRRLRPLIGCPQQGLCGEFLVQHRPRAKDVDAVVGDKSAARQRSALRAEILGGVAQRREQRRLRLRPILAGDLRVGDGGSKLGVVLFGALERVVQGHDRRRGGRPLRTNELERTGRHILRTGSGRRQ